jgi:hypothetical protein
MLGEKGTYGEHMGNCRKLMLKLAKNVQRWWRYWRRLEPLQRNSSSNY